MNLIDDRVENMKKQQIKGVWTRTPNENPDRLLSRIEESIVERFENKTGNKIQYCEGSELDAESMKSMTGFSDVVFDKFFE